GLLVTREVEFVADLEVGRRGGQVEGRGPGPRPLGAGAPQRRRPDLSDAGQGADRRAVAAVLAAQADQAAAEAVRVIAGGAALDPLFQLVVGYLKFTRPVGAHRIRRTPQGHVPLVNEVVRTQLRVDRAGEIEGAGRRRADAVQLFRELAIHHAHL